MPAETPNTWPDELIVAMEVLVTDHVPDGAPSISVIDDPMHTLVGPLIVPETGPGLTVSVTEVVSWLHPLFTSRPIAVVPAVSAFPIPVVRPIVATEVLVLCQ